MKKRRAGLAILFVLLFSTFSHMHAVSAITWSDENRRTVYSYGDSAPHVTQTCDRRIWIVWEREVSSRQAIFYMTSSDYGISWSLEKNLTNVPSADTNLDPSITQLSNGTIIVVWSSNRPPPPEPDFNLSAHPSSLSIPQGSSNTSTITVTSVAGFSDPVNLSVKSIMPPSPWIYTDFDPEQVTPPPNGNANSTLTISVGAETLPINYIIIVTGRSESLNKTKSVNIELTVTSATGASTTAANPRGTTPPLISPSETQNDYEIYYKVSHDNGTSWSKATRLTQHPASDMCPSVLQASNGTIWVVWSSKRTDDYEIFCKTSSDMGATWTNGTQLTFDTALDTFPAIAQLSDGRIWLVWHSGRYQNNGGMEILYNIYDGSSWLGEERLTGTSKDIDDTCPAILQTTNETIWIFWASEGDYQAPFILYKQSFNNGDTWSETSNSTTGLTDKYPATTQTCDSKIWVVWASLRDGNFEIYYRTSLVHNVAVTNIIPSEDKVYQEEIVAINATIQNYGDYNETFTVTCYANSTSIGSESVALNSSAADTLAFTWDTSSFVRGNYRIKVNASMVDGEAYTDDNTGTYNKVRVKLLGDIDDNGVVDASDLSTLSGAYGSASGNPNWVEEADMNGDNKVDTLDLLALGKNYGETG